MKQKNTVLFINQTGEDALAAVKEYGRQNGHRMRSVVLVDSRRPRKQPKAPGVHEEVACDFGSPNKIMQALLPYQDNLLTVVCRGESNLRLLSRLVPHVPYLRLPTASSLLWSTDKVMMRQRLRIFEKALVPRFAVVQDASQEAQKKIIEKVKFPLVLKPAGLAMSLLVSVCYHEEDLAKDLQKISRKIQKIYRESNNKEQPKILAEQLMEGEMYSIDAYVNARGKCWFCPPVYVKTGRAIGFDDFFGYMRLLPTGLDKHEVKECEKAGEKAIWALGLRSTTVHIELMLVNGKWKIIELSPRMGGFRQQLYGLAYGIDHAQNDLWIRLGKQPKISRKRRGFAVMMQFFGREEGVIEKISGVKKIKLLKSFVKVTVNKKPGDKATWAKHGGKSVVNLTLCNKTRSGLLADIRRSEQALKIRMK